MKVSFQIPFQCEQAMIPHLEKIFSGGEYDVPIMIPSGSHIIDLGANAGAFSIWATHRWPGCTIEAYEPHPLTYTQLKQNTEKYPNIKIHNFGVGDPGWRVLKNGPSNSGEASFHDMMNNFGATGQHLEVKSPEILSECTIMKLDIEACEVEVLEPYIASGKRPEIIMLEYHAEAIRRKVDDILKDYTLIDSEVQHICGRGVVKYLRDDIHRDIFIGKT